MFVQWFNESDKFSTSEKINLDIISQLISFDGVASSYLLDCEALRALTLRGYLFWWNQACQVNEWRHLGMENMLVMKFGRKLVNSQCSFQNIDTESLPLLYKTFVQPHLKYGITVWGPFNRTDQKLHERVQRRATKLVLSIRHLPYTDRLCHLKIPRLHYRRRRADMIVTYQILNGEPDIKTDQFFSLASVTTTRGHQWKLRSPRLYFGSEGTPWQYEP